MKVLHFLSSNIFSGAENVACQIISMFDVYNDIQMVYSSPIGPIKDSLDERGITFAPMSKMCKKEIKRIISDFKPDIIHAHDRTASYLSSKVANGIPVLVHMHVNNNKGLRLFLKNLLWLSNAKRYNHIFWVSQSSFDGFPFHKRVIKKSAILYNVIDSSLLLQRCKEDLQDYDYDVAYCGRLSYQKNPVLLMNVCNSVISKISNVKIAIIGDGAFGEYVKDYIESNHLDNNVKFYGFLKNPFKIISQSKVLILTSRFEGTPMVAIEAQTLGVPIVSTPVDGMKDIIKNNFNGFLKNDVDGLSNSIVRLLNDNRLRAKMSHNSSASVKKFCDIDKYRNTLLNKYNELLDEK